MSNSITIRTRTACLRLAAFTCAVLVAASASAVVVPTDCVPPPDTYFGGFHAQYNAGLINLSDPQHQGFDSCLSPGPPGTVSHEQFGSTVKANISVNNGAPQAMQAPANCAVQMVPISDDGTTRVFQTEMLQLDISGGTLPPGTMIRESPTLQSTGQTTIKSLGTNYQIDSFFDIFTELSIDGGQTWFPSTDQGGASYAGHVALGGSVGAELTPWSNFKTLYRNP